MGLILTYAIYEWQKGDDKPGSPVQNNQNVQNGNCVAQGSNNNLNCAPAPKSVEKLDFIWQGGVSFLFDGPPSAIPRPPDYSPGAIRSHCGEWLSWMGGQPKVYATIPTFAMSLQAGSPDILTVTGITASVTKRLPAPKDYVLIKCKYGAGGDAGYFISVNTVSGVTKVEDYNTGKKGVMPPFSIKLQGRDSGTVIISVESRKGYLYTGNLTASLDFNGRTVAKEFGFGDYPGEFRWLGGRDFDFTRPTYDWDLEKKRWVRVIGETPPGEAS
ncbi:hypothetical protein AGRA3207_007266 [Actinomadura graeca]|uniref:Uncharacterized protein n=1 Tax=Actinomadura graeca TaxID=2750812 RepID=A0ABX8R656_9ACTN|nr:hypothetical protein [Actinomadura graeca]QXJ25734.1 hypothetical protein AGRA3207_007266 [Actinomadura graeca]